MDRGMLHVVHCISSISTVLPSLSNFPVSHSCLILSLSLSFFLSLGLRLSGSGVLFVWPLSVVSLVRWSA